MFVLGSQSTLGPSGAKLVTRQYLFDRICSFNLPSIEEKVNFLKEDLLSSEKYHEDQITSFKRRFAHFKSEIKQRWSKACKKEDVFRKSNEKWLQGTFELPAVPTQNRTGRPCKMFDESSERSKRRKTEDVRSVLEGEVIVHAAQIELRKTGKRDASEVLKNIMSSPTKATKYKKALNESKTEADRLTPFQALAMFVDADLTRRQYEIIRNTNKNFFPCYTLLQKAKQECYPHPNECQVTSTSAGSNLQALTDLTVRRLSMYLEEVLLTLQEQERENLKLICKWGCDGSQQSKYKQKFENDEDSDANIFQSCFVPLRLVCGEDDQKIVWENPKPSSPRFCRLIRFRFVKESTDVTEEEINHIKTAANELTPTEVILKENKFVIKHIFIMTMVDGKVCNAATGTKSTSRCFICGATSKDFNNLDINKEVNVEAIEFGLSVLHARIRIFESILHLAYKLEVKKYRERKTEAEKNIEKEAKLRIQKEFREKTGLLVDMPKANFGNTNDGNTSRRFFEDPKLASDITRIDYNLIYRLKVILEVISSGYPIDHEKYEKYAEDTVRLYKSLYDWHPMTPTMHKILRHGSIVIKNALLPIGQLSEEAAEARNKHFRNYRQNYARKFSREACNRDILNRLLLSSDPLISSMRNSRKSNMKSFSPETIAMFISATPNSQD